MHRGQGIRWGLIGGVVLLMLTGYAVASPIHQTLQTQCLEGLRLLTNPYALALDFFSDNNDATFPESCRLLWTGTSRRVIVELSLKPVITTQKDLEELGVKGSQLEDSLAAHFATLDIQHNQVLADIQTAAPTTDRIHDFRFSLNGMSLIMPEEDVSLLRTIKGIKAIHPVTPVSILLNESVAAVNATQVWMLQNASGSNITGTGVSIAIIDTGIDYGHLDLGNCTTPTFLAGNCTKVVGGYDLVNDDADPTDDHGHGTHCAGIAAGNGIVKGVAPDAILYGYKVLDSEGSGTSDDIIAGIERALDPNQDNDTSDHVDVISMSLGGAGDPWDVMSQAVDNAVDAGVVVVVAAGNSGPDLETIGSPGAARNVITVGAACRESQNGSEYCTDSTTPEIAEFSSRGPTYMYQKPDIIAPGVRICAAQWSDAYNTSQCLDDDHIAMSGTSMATPHVAGAAALLLQLHPTWTPAEVKASLEDTANPYGYGGDTEGAGLIDVYAASQLSQKPPVAFLYDIPEATYQ